MSEPQDTTRLLAGLLRAHYGTAVEKAGWTPGWKDDAERILAALEVVPASRLQEATEALRRAKRGHCCRPSSRYDGDCPCGATKHNARIDAALDSLGGAQPQSDATSEKPSPSTPAEGPEAASGPSLDGSERLTVYLAGPMAGLPEHNFPAFHAETARLRGLGYNVLSPAEKAGDQAAVSASTTGLAFRETQTYKDFLKADLRMVLDADAVALLPGWENSRGAQLEIHVAKAVGIDVWYPSSTGALTTRGEASGE